MSPLDAGFLSCKYASKSAQPVAACCAARAMFEDALVRLAKAKGLAKLDAAKVGEPK
jgi:hypothetical protein